MSENKLESGEFRGWLDENDNLRLNLNEVIMITFSDGVSKPITLHLKSGKEIGLENTTTNMSDREVFESLSDYLKNEIENEDKRKIRSLELLESILSELKSISVTFKV